MRLLALPITLALCAASLPAAAVGLRDRLYDPGGGVLVVAHRACHRAAPSHGFEHGVPENSLAALERCVALGVDLVEIDVRRTRDGQLVVMHDARVDRTTDGKGRVADLTLAEIQTLRLKDEGRAGGSEAPPTLEAVLQAARGRILVNVDLKGPYAAEAAQIARRVDATDWVLFKAKARFGAPPLADQAPYRDLPFMPMVAAKAARHAGDLGRITARQASGARQIPAVEMVSLKRNGFTAVRDAARAARIRVWTNTLASRGWRGVLDQSGDRKALRDPDKAWGRLINEGVSIVQTDYPAALLDYLNRRGLRGQAAIAVADAGSPFPASRAGASRTR
ncbi:glycerophosphodiester phosphodiesterase family protein [Caulobacter sp.]|uniref:glycerophosphodiester phosphodiesterase family protein n=1 Tax=Caulobacter sp. TaxID=78 RepID=UPI002B47D0E9|nr:glycerophosphodiester phosphodiesterase family protein [Caulobacter sp.]HJV41878.1 glycerophosphodiester phosphodiesterase family protein [Caulobacter sp.]